MSRILAIDPGNRESAYVVLQNYSAPNGAVEQAAIVPNKELLAYIEDNSREDAMAIEMVESFGMAVGKEVFETVFWIGRFCQAWHIGDGSEAHRIYRKDVKMHLCHNMRAKDGNIRQALIDKLGPQGTKKSPGPTYGISKHLWSALAVGVTYAEIGARE